VRCIACYSHAVILQAMALDLRALAAVPLFASVDRQRLTGLAERSRARSADPGTVVAAQGAPCTHLIVVEAGALTALHDTVHGQRLRLGEFAAPCAVDKMAILDRGSHCATWMASIRSRIRLVPADDLFGLIDDVRGTRHHVLRHLAASLRDQQSDHVRSAFADATTRTAAWLVRAAGRTGSRVILPGAQQGLAESIGMSRVAVNRALQTLVREGLVRVERSAVVVVAPELLARRATAGL